MKMRDTANKHHGERKNERKSVCVCVCERGGEREVGATAGGRE